MIRPSLISSISPLPQYGFWPNVISTESYVQGEPNGVGYKKFGQELAEDVGYYWRINYSGLIRDISAFQFRPCLHWPSSSFVKCFPSILDRFQRDLESFGGRSMGFLVGFLGFWTFVGWKVCCEAGD